MIKFLKLNLTQSPLDGDKYLNTPWVNKKPCLKSKIMKVDRGTKIIKKPKRCFLFFDFIIFINRIRNESIAKGIPIAISNCIISPITKTCASRYLILLVFRYLMKK
jgi:hypothetical protein